MFEAGECTLMRQMFSTGDNRMRVILAAVTLVAVANGSANAYLGGFENTDGYIDVIPYFYGKKFDVAHYNSGQFGFNAGGGVYNNSAGAGALWKHLPGSVLQPALGAFGSETYATGHQSYDRDFVNNTGGAQNDLALVITTNGDGWNALPREYSYKLDQYDLNGGKATGPSIPTASAANSRLKVSWWSCINSLEQEKVVGFPQAQSATKFLFMTAVASLVLRLATSNRERHWTTRGTVPETLEPAEPVPRFLLR